MWFQFFLENAHFTISLLSALTTFAVAWLYFDAWSERKTLKEGLRTAGFLLLSLSFLSHASFLETTILATSFLGERTHTLLLLSTRLPGYLLIIASLLIDPLQPRPKTQPSKPASPLPALVAALVLIPGVSIASLALPILAFLICLLYFRRSIFGLERHLFPLGLSFLILGIFELLASASLLRSTDNPTVYELVAPFGIVWIEEHIALLLATLILGKWVSSYLLKRLASQLFMIFTSSILVVFLATTISFTTLLLRNLQSEALTRLTTDVKVLSFALDSKKAEALSDAQVLAVDPKVVEALETGSRSVLADIAQSFLLTKRQSFLVVVGENGQVLARGEDRERIGDSLSGDPLIKRALVGEPVSSVVTKDAPLSPQVSVRAATPIKKARLDSAGQDETIIGAVMTGTTIDNAFADAIKKATDLESTVFANDVVSATTLSLDGRNRLVGIKEENLNVKARVLKDGETFTGAVTLLNKPYFAAYVPLLDVDNTPVGMLFVGKEQVSVLQTAGRSIELTFLVTAALLLLSVLPAYLIARYISSQLK